MQNFAKTAELGKPAKTSIKKPALSGKEVKNMESKVEVEVCTEDLDEAIEKANRLVELLREAQQIIDSLFGKSEA